MCPLVDFPIAGHPLMRRIEELLLRPARANMVADFIVAQALKLAQEQKLNRVLDPARARQRLVGALGLHSIPRSSPVVSVVGSRAWRDYAVDKLVFEATPGLPVPALLYRPATPDPHPAVVHAPGHWMEDAKLTPDIQRTNLRLVRNGIAVLCYDTIGQGERRVGWHQHGQLAPVLAGFTTLGLMVRDSIGALDVLEAHPDIDGSRLAIAGASGGGFSSIFAAAIDERVSAAAIACIVNTHVSQIHDAAFGTGWDSWIDLCNQVPGLCTIGTMGDILSTIAPRNLLVANADQDPGFPLEGAREVVTEVHHHYDRLGVTGRFAYEEVSGDHGLPAEMRAVVCAFLSERLRVEDRRLESEEVPFPPRWAVTHEVATAYMPQTTCSRPSAGACLDEPVDTNDRVVQLAQERAASLRASRQPLSAPSVHSVIGRFPDRTQLNPRVTNHVALSDGFAQRLSLAPEEGIELDCLFLLPASWSDELPPVVVVLDEGGKAQALQSAATSHARREGCAVFLPDLRGTGESAASEFEVATASWMLDRDLLNQRVWDVIRVVDYLSARYSTGQQIDKGRIVLWGLDAFGLVALLAGALDLRVAAVGTTGPKSLEELLVRDPTITPMAYRYQLLEVLDLADLGGVMSPRPSQIGIAPDGAAQVLAGLVNALDKRNRAS